MNKRGFQLSINMFVVLIISLLILGLGFSLFAEGADSITVLTEQVDAQTESQLNRLLDDGSILVMPFRDQEVKKGETAIFNLGLSNELGSEKSFYVSVTYAGASVDTPSLFPPNLGALDHVVNPQGYSCAPQQSNCWKNWIQVPLQKTTLPNNDRKAIPIGITLPKDGVDLPRGQYIFNVDVCQVDATINENQITCNSELGANPPSLANRYGTRLKLYLTLT